MSKQIQMWLQQTKIRWTTRKERLPTPSTRMFSQHRALNPAQQSHATVRPCSFADRNSNCHTSLQCPSSWSDRALAWPHSGVFSRYFLYRLCLLPVREKTKPTLSIHSLFSKRILTVRENFKIQISKYPRSQEFFILLCKLPFPVLSNLRCY